MKSQEIYKDVKLISDQIIRKAGTVYLKIGLVTDFRELPIKIPKLYLWYVSSNNESVLIITQLYKYYGLELPNNINGLYLYVYEIME